MTEKIKARKEELTATLDTVTENLNKNRKTLGELQKAISDDELRTIAITSRLDEIELLTAQ
jgi:predicted  nucleic acid-binding Zn-ribbon protein